MSELTLLQVMLVICSLVCNVASMAYRLGKDVHGSARKRTRRHKRSRRSHK